MFAILEEGGKQFYVTKDQVIFIEKRDGKEGDVITFENEKILMVNDRIGKPFVEGASIKGVIEKQGKQKKIIVFRHNHKSTHKRKYGHRQPYTRVKITGIEG